MLNLKNKNKKEISVSKNVLDKIRIEEKKHKFKEFGGWLVVKNNRIEDVIFDMDAQSGGSVDLGSEVIRTLPPNTKKLIKGWFHKHPITGLSGTDEEAIAQLTEFWGECYTMVLQSSGKILVLKQ